MLLRGALSLIPVLVSTAASAHEGASAHVHVEALDVPAISLALAGLLLTGAAGAAVLATRR